MAWYTCPHCQQRKNGWSNSDTHQRKEHPAEYRIAEAQKSVEWAEERLARNTKAKEEYQMLDSILVQNDLPQLVVDILTKERDSRTVTLYMQGERVVIPFDEQIAEDTKWLAKKRAELAALQPAEVTS